MTPALLLIVGALLALALALAVVEIVTAYRRAARAVAS